MSIHALDGVCTCLSAVAQRAMSELVCAGGLDAAVEHLLAFDCLRVSRDLSSRSRSRPYSAFSRIRGILACAESVLTEIRAVGALDVVDLSLLPWCKGSVCADDSRRSRGGVCRRRLRVHCACCSYFYEGSYVESLYVSSSLTMFESDYGLDIKLVLVYSRPLCSSVLLQSVFVTPWSVGIAAR